MAVQREHLGADLDAGRVAGRIEQSVQAHDTTNVAARASEVEYAQSAEAVADRGGAFRVDFIALAQRLERGSHARLQQRPILEKRLHEPGVLLRA